MNNWFFLRLRRFSSILFTFFSFKPTFPFSFGDAFFLIFRCVLVCVCVYVVWTDLYRNEWWWWCVSSSLFTLLRSDLPCSVCCGCGHTTFEINILIQFYLLLRMTLPFFIAYTHSCTLLFLPVFVLSQCKNIDWRLFSVVILYIFFFPHFLLWVDSWVCCYFHIFVYIPIHVNH